MNFKSTIVALTCLTTFAGTSWAGNPEVEILHWWTEASTARALQILKDKFKEEGGKWTDMPVAGTGGDAARVVLKSRVLAGNPPVAFQMKGPSIQEWNEQGVLADLSGVKGIDTWDKVLPKPIAAQMKCEGTYCAAPVNIHRTNWLWANPKVLAKAGVSMPRTWADFNKVAERLKAAGVIPLAHGGQPWQDATLFEAVALGMGGADFFQKALVKLDEATLRSDTMVAIFDEMRVLRGFVDDNFAGREWNMALAMLMRGEAAFQVMGDWALGEFAAAKKVPGVDYLCETAPGTGFLFNVDSFAMFKVDDADKQAGQKIIARLLMDKDFQVAFNLAKGSIPVRTDVPMSAFSYCAQKSLYDLTSSETAGTLLPSFAHNMALRDAPTGAIVDVVTRHFNSDMSSKDAVELLVKAVKDSQS